LQQEEGVEIQLFYEIPNFTFNKDVHCIR